MTLSQYKQQYKRAAKKSTRERIYYSAMSNLKPIEYKEFLNFITNIFNK